MTSILPRLILVLIGAGYLLARVVSTRRGSWGSGDWLKFAGRLAFYGGLVVLGIAMAFGVDYHAGIAGPGQSTQRMLYVVLMMLMVLYGVVSLVDTPFSGAGEGGGRGLMRGYLHTTMVFVILACLGALVAGRMGVAPYRGVIVVFGGFMLWIGAAMPLWIQTMVRGHIWMSRLSPLQVRLVYLGLGVVLVAMGVAGWPAAWFR
ncbi:MAG TPA: hypothetical protein VJN95_15205 [Gemmatimonadales bacterium]|nr:hypothetical protein [Gemmatimonadales bacterium]